MHERRLGEAFAADDAQTLLVDYTRLFLGPAQPLAKPDGSVWLTGAATLMQEATMAVLELYRQGGFEIDEEFRELPDHVAVDSSSCTCCCSSAIRHEAATQPTIWRH